jgi:hypothetical protein
MPIKVSSYACKFRCGWVRANFKSVENHEKTCFGNPGRKACRTCFFWDQDEEGRFCRKFEDDRGSKDLQFNCEGWFPKPN